MRRVSTMEKYMRNLEQPADNAERSTHFYNSLRYFYKRKWNANLVAPHVGGIEVDLFKLYDIVSQYGGWQRVTQRDRWSEVAFEVLGMGEDVVGADYGVKLLYMRYLSKFEQTESVGDVDDHDQETMSRNRFRGYSLHVSSECPINQSKREVKAGDEARIDRIVKSLSSSLQNEVDMAFNSLHVMSCPGPLALQLEGYITLLPLMIAHGGVFDDSSSYLEVFMKNTGERVRDFSRYWAMQGIKDPEVLNMLNVKEVPNYGSVFGGLNETALDEKLRKVLDFRAGQVVNIIRNLAFEECNKGHLAQSCTVIKYLIVCAASNNYPLRNSALDAFSEIATHLVLTEEFMEIYSNVLLRLIRSFFLAEDRFLVIRAAEIAGGMCHVAENEVMLNDFFDADLVERLRDLITVQDILICSHVLESLYNMSETGKAICDRICSAPQMVKLLVDFTTVEAPRFGVTGLQGIKVIEYHDESESRVQYVQQPQPQQQYAIRTVSASAQSTPTAVRVVPAVQQLPAAAQYRPHVVVNSKGEFPVPHTPQPPKGAIAITAQLAKPPEMTSEQRVEHYSKIWIRQNCTVDPKGAVDRGDIYAAYVEHFRSTHKILSCSLQNFCKFVKDIFPAIELKSNPLMKSTTIEGITFLKKEKGQHIVEKPTTSEANENLAPPPEPESNGSAKVVQTKRNPTEIIFEVCPAPVEAARSLPVSVNEAKIERIENNAVNEKPVEKLCNGYAPKAKEEQPVLNGYKDSERVANGVCNGVEKPSNGETKSNGVSKPGPTPSPQPHCSVDHEEIVETTETIDSEKDAEEESEQDDAMEIARNGDTSKVEANSTTQLDELVVDEDEPTPSTSEATTPSGSQTSRTATELTKPNEKAEKSTEESDDSPAEPEADEKKEPEAAEKPANKPLNGELSKKTRKRPAGAAVDELKAAPSAKKLKGRKSANNNEKPLENGTAVQDSPTGSATNSTTVEETPSTSTAAPTPRPAPTLMCEWSACSELCHTPQSMLYHILHTHLPKGQATYCRWPGCERTSRSNWSLITHLQDHHCNDNALNAALKKRREMGDSAYLAQIKKTLEVEPPLHAHQGYSKFAASDAIRRHAFNYLSKDITDEPEGPVTKSLRLTSCLILRNLARHSLDGRKRIRPYEGYLSYLAMSRMESSVALAQCLSAINSVET